MNLADQLQKLQTLREQGALTEDEFTLAKKRLLDGSESPETVNSAARHEPSALNRFRRSLTDKWIGGVCAGLAKLTEIPTWAWRILFLLTILLHGLGLLVYILLWIFVPAEAHERPALSDEGTSP